MVNACTPGSDRRHSLHTPIGSSISGADLPNCCNTNPALTDYTTPIPMTPSFPPSAQLTPDPSPSALTSAPTTSGFTTALSLNHTLRDFQAIIEPSCPIKLAMSKLFGDHPTCHSLQQALLTEAITSGVQTIVAVMLTDVGKQISCL
ncbi:hypothetical protein BOTBODRAFT_175729 [Botryobasidium botryosum FD-172 SS1]|uniref:Uncharacterized protein n=1 Tax=Botryobasidium botryosum (strain FD-172 SS1) TaxID=930990 RepID=A0A067MEH8_BOTB1|nr:hypothetical protein BOTBODRAFT_175729 [Botryobasidium botryosum FD-172 SS1]